MKRGDYFLSRIHGSDNKAYDPFYYCIVLRGDGYGYYVDALPSIGHEITHNIRIHKRFVCYQVNDVARIVELKLKGLTL